MDLSGWFHILWFPLLYFWQGKTDELALFVTMTCSDMDACNIIKVLFFWKYKIKQLTQRSAGTRAVNFI